MNQAISILYELFFSVFVFVFRLDGYADIWADVVLP